MDRVTSAKIKQCTVFTAQSQAAMSSISVTSEFHSCLCSLYSLVWQTGVYLYNSPVVFNQSHITQAQGNLLQLSGSSSVYAESSQFSGSIGRSGSDSYALYKDCKFSPDLQVQWAQSIGTVYVASSCVALP